MKYSNELLDDSETEGVNYSQSSLEGDRLDGRGEYLRQTEYSMKK